MSSWHKRSQARVLSRLYIYTCESETTHFSLIEVRTGNRDDIGRSLIPMNHVAIRHL